MFALHQLAHGLFQVPTTLGQENLLAGIGVLVVFVTGLVVKLIQYFKSKARQKATGD